MRGLYFASFFLCFFTLKTCYAVPKPASLAKAFLNRSLDASRSAIARTWNASRETSERLDKRDGTKYVFMHHRVFNVLSSEDTYPYTMADWVDDIQRIEAKGVDAIALNLGGDTWQRSQVASAYAAAASINSKTKLFLSFDFTAMPCDVEDLIDRVNQFGDHQNQFHVNGKPMISSFSGDCLGNSGWATLKSRTNAYLMPFVWGLEGQFDSWPSLDSWYCWGCAWPQGDYDKTTGDDEYYMSQLGSRYATTVSNWMYTHYSYKNWYKRGDDWLLASRWEQLMDMRDRLTFVEMISWNDYGESHYFGPIKGAQPDGTTWTDNFPHAAWYDMSEYYITAFKTGSYPAITQDVIYYWARPHAASAIATSDRLARPVGFDWTSDTLWAVVFASSPSSVTLRCGSSAQTFDDVKAGVTKLKIPLSPGKITVIMVRNGATIINDSPADYTFSTDPSLYNYNAYVGSAKAVTTPPASTSTASPPSTTSPTQTTSSAASTTTAVPTSSSTTISGVDWTYLGCYPDYTPRTLNNGFMTSATNQSVATCLAMCGARGYTFGGIEYGVECWCSSAITAGVEPTDPRDCNMPCSGKASDVCGAGNRLSLYHVSKIQPSGTTTSQTPTSSASPPTGSGFAYYGCVAEGTTGSRRALSGPSFSRSNMTPVLCQSLCSNYRFAAVEYGDECYCGNSLTNNGATGDRIPEGECSMPCAGDASQKCGASWMLSVYQNSKTGPSTDNLPNGWTRAGCFTDSWDRILRHSFTDQPGMTASKCIGICSAQGQSIAATEYGSQCLCGSQFFKSASAGALVGSADCNMKCNGDTSENCGASWRANVYTRPGISLSATVQINL